MPKPEENQGNGGGQTPPTKQERHAKLYAVKRIELLLRALGLYDERDAERLEKEARKWRSG